MCVLFGSQEAGRGSQRLIVALVTRPLQNWKDAKEVMKSHSILKYHKTAMRAADHVMLVGKHQTPHIADQLDASRKIEFEKNRHGTLSIVETIIFCGRQEIPLRGHRGECEDLNAGSCDAEINDGNFRPLLRMRLRCGDDGLKFPCHHGRTRAFFLNTSENKNIFKKFIER